jgi:hypothetical protein
MSYIIQNNNLRNSTSKPFTVISFTAANTAAVCVLLQNFLNANNLNIISLQFSSHQNQHDIILVYTN